MKALTICQPYAHLICLPETHPHHKRVENRTWATNYRGTLLIHAGRSQQWLDAVSAPYDHEAMNYGIPFADMVFGAFVATAELITVAHVDAIHAGRCDIVYPWLRSHEHTEGPYCWVLGDVRPLTKPVPWRGAQGLWAADYNEVRAATGEALPEKQFRSMNGGW